MSVGFRYKTSVRRWERYELSFKHCATSGVVCATFCTGAGARTADSATLADAAFALNSAIARASLHSFYPIKFVKRQWQVCLSSARRLNPYLANTMGAIAAWLTNFEKTYLTSFWWECVRAETHFAYGPRDLNEKSSFTNAFFAKSASEPKFGSLWPPSLHRNKHNLWIPYALLVTTIAHCAIGEVHTKFSGLDWRGPLVLNSLACKKSKNLFVWT